MNRTYGLFLAAFVSLGSSCWAQADASNPSQASVHINAADQPLVALRVIAPAGSQFDPPGKEGLAAVTAALIAEGGTQSLTYDEILKRFYPMAAGFNHECFKEYAVFQGVVHRDNAEAYSTLVAEMLGTPRFGEEDFQRIKNELLDYLTKTLRGNNDEGLGKQVLELSIYGKGHPYGHVSQGTVAGLKSITLDDVRAFHSRHYNSDTLALGTAGVPGDFADRFQGALNRKLSTGATDFPPLPLVESPVGLQVTIVEKPTDATAISIGFPITLTRSDDAFYPLFLANSYLGEHRTFNGQLMLRLRRDRGLNYGDYSYIEEFVQEGGSSLPVPNNKRRQQFFSIWIRPVPHDKAAFALRAGLYELARLNQEGLSPQDFEATRTYLLNFSNLWQQSLDRQLGYAMEGRLYGRESDVAKTLQERLPTTTLEEVNTLVRKHLNPKGMRIVIVTADAEALKRQLESGAATPLKYDTEGTPEAILQEDKKIERFELEGLKVRIIPASSLFESAGLPEPDSPATHNVLAEADYYADSPAQMRPPDGKLAKGASVTLIKREGSYARVKFRSQPNTDMLEAWVAFDVLEPISR
jgi:zinc protease